MWRVLMRAKYLKQPTVPPKIETIRDVSGLTESMRYIGFQGRMLAAVVDVWSRMLKKENNVIWLGLAGALVPAGMRRILSYLIKRRMIDVLVSTGANLYHDVFEALGGHHYMGSTHANDVQLRRNRIDRIYDIFADENKFYRVDVWIQKKFTEMLVDNYPYSSREILYQLGKMLHEKAREKDSIILSAYNAGVPIFCPTIGDSSLGFSIMFANRAGRSICIDGLKDVHESSLITQKASKTGVIYLGGGVPKNFIQQTAVVASYQTRHDRSHDSAIQITTDMPMWGGLSGCTFEEAQSWGKIGPKAKMAVCYCDVTIALPIVANALSQRFPRLRRNTSEFIWKDDDLKIDFHDARL
jgi:deoxyhypusine synthase